LFLFPSKDLIGDLVLLFHEAGGGSVFLSLVLTPHDELQLASTAHLTQYNVLYLWLLLRRQPLVLVRLLRLLRSQHVLCPNYIVYGTL
jgi:hypothetical protein